MNALGKRSKKTDSIKDLFNQETLKLLLNYNVVNRFSFQHKNIFLLFELKRTAWESKKVTPDYRKSVLSRSK